MREFFRALGYFLAWLAILIVLTGSYVAVFLYAWHTAPCPPPPIEAVEIVPEVLPKPAPPPKVEAPKVLPKPTQKAKPRPKAKPADCDRAKQNARSYAELMRLAQQAGVQLTIAERRAAAQCFRA